jgi:hypothetical protein
MDKKNMSTTTTTTTTTTTQKWGIQDQKQREMYKSTIRSVS